MPPTPPLPTLDPIDVKYAAARLQAKLLQQVQDPVRQSPASVQRWITLARAMLAAHDTPIDRAQVVVVVDRNPLVQQLALIVAQPDAPWIMLGGTHVPAGQPNRYGYYRTPTGVFLHDGSVLDYRAQGTFNENHIRGLGVKGMRIWDFGWQWADKGWLHTGERGQIRLLMHATDPAYLARRIGRPASEGRGAGAGGQETASWIAMACWTPTTSRWRPTMRSTAPFCQTMLTRRRSPATRWWWSTPRKSSSPL